jgi:hypothetical protein
MPAGRISLVLLGAVTVAAVALLWNVFFVAPDWREGFFKPAPGERHARLVKLTPEQYRNTISDIFGSAIRIDGRFIAVVPREDGLLAVGSSSVSFTAAGLEAADALAESIAGQVFSPRMRPVTMPCSPRAPDAADPDCAREFFSRVGMLLLRRPLDAAEVEAMVRIASSTADAGRDFYFGMELALQNLLIDPQFLFRVEEGVAAGDAFELTAFGKASRLSFFLWNAPPDEALLEAAKRGDLDSPSGRAAQAERMMGSARFEQGVRAFFTDLLGFEGFATLSKDAALFPKFTAIVPRDAQEQTLRTIVDHLVTRNGDYRDLFTTRRTFLTPTLGALYRVPVIVDVENGAVDPWVPHEFAPGDRRDGILAHVSFLALNSHAGRSSPTHRGKALREQLLCQKVPPPPGDVDFSLVQDISSPHLKTARMRLDLHNAQPACSGCHKITDPIGLALENFDAAGEFRTMENGALIDASGELHGVEYDGPAGLSSTLRNDPTVSACLVKRVYAYATVQPTGSADLGTLADLQETFAGKGYRLRDLMQAIAADEAMYRISRPRPPSIDRPVLASLPQSSGTAALPAVPGS